MKKSNQSGFGAIELILTVVIVGILGFIGWYVWHTSRSSESSSPLATKTETTDKTAQTCRVNSSTTGTTYKAPYQTYQVCLPDGWKLYMPDGADAQGSALLTTSSDMTYHSGVAATVSQTGGKDGEFPFSIFYNRGSQPTSFEDYQFTGTVVAQNGLSGKSYYRLETKAVDPNMGAVPKGTKQYSYVFGQGDQELVIDYNQFPGDADNSAIVKDVASTANLPSK